MSRGGAGGKEVVTVVVPKLLEEVHLMQTEGGVGRISSLYDWSNVRRQTKRL